MSLFDKFFRGAPAVPESTQVERVYSAFRATFMEMHSEAHARRQRGDASLASFIERYLDDTRIESKICSTAVQGMRQVVRQRKEATDGFAIGQSVAVNVQAVPVLQSASIEWYQTTYGGFLGYIESVVAPVLAGRGFTALVHVTFGQDAGVADWQLWASIAVMNFGNPQVVSNFVPDSLLTVEQLARAKNQT